MFEPPLAASVVDEDSSHRLGRGRKEVPTPVPLPDLGNFDKPQIGFMDQGRRVESLSGPLLSHSLRGELAQFVIDQRQQFLGRDLIALIDRREDRRHVAHSSEYTGGGAWDSKQFPREIPAEITRLTPTRQAVLSVVFADLRFFSAGGRLDVAWLGDESATEWNFGTTSFHKQDNVPESEMIS